MSNNMNELKIEYLPVTALKPYEMRCYYAE